MRAASNLALSGGLKRAGGDFHAFRLGRRVLYLHRSLASYAPAIFAMLGRLDAAQGTGNRRSGFALQVGSGLELFARFNRRGGLAARLSGELYFGRKPRPVEELFIAAQAWRRGVPLAEPVGAMVEWRGPLIYRGAFLSRALGGMTLWEFLQTDDDPRVRAHVIEQTRRAIDTMHRAGLFHADLNLNNLFVTQSGESFAISILDLDKARLFERPLAPALRRRNLARMLRSARKLDPAGRYINPHLLDSLTRQ